MPYDKDSNVAGRSKEVDAEAFAAASAMNANPNSFKTNDEDSANTHASPQGNPEDPAFNPGREIGKK